MKEIIVIGLAYSTTMGLIRSVGEAGYGVRLISLNRFACEIASKSRYVTQVRQIQLVFDELFNTLEELRGEDDRILVLPSLDRACMMLDQHADSLSDHYDLPNIKNESGAVAVFMDKMIQKKLAKECGLPVAEGNVYETASEGIQSALKEVAFPCIIKPSASASIIDSKDIITVCSDREELASGMKTARSKGCISVLAERYLNVERELSAYGVVCDGRVSIPACVETKRSGVGHLRGITAEGKVLSSDVLGGSKQKLEKLVQTSGFNGLFCIDLLVSDGVIYFSEMNLRCGSSEYAVTAAGVNLPGMLIDAYDKGIGIDDSAQITKPVRFVNEKVVLDSYRGGHIRWREYLSALKDNEVGFVRDKQDPGPWREYQKLVLRKIAAKIIKGPQG